MRGCCNKISSTSRLLIFSPPRTIMSFTPGDFDVSRVVHPAQVATVIPTFFIQRTGGQFGFIEVAHKNIGTTRGFFTFYSCGQGIARFIDDFNFDPAAA